ncbi:Trehalose-6-P synthase/phosphatase complex synthase subunit [Orobanche hederae]
MNPSAAASVTTLDDIRQSVIAQPSVWGTHFLAYSSNATEISAAEKEESARQKELVRELLAEMPDDSADKLELIDVIQRLGVDYHFEKEIDESLHYIHENYPKYNTKDDEDDLRILALRFRLLRQHGYYVPCDVFDAFVDGEKGNIFPKEPDTPVKNVEAMLSLYEAAHFGQHGEEILDKAIELTSTCLKESLVLPQIKSNVSLSTRITEALKMPLRMTLKRFGARKFISMYEKDETHDKLLLNFAKLDFNIVQKIHQREISDLTRWWNAFDVSNKLPYARDRIAECYFWVLEVYFEPHYGKARRILTKAISMASIIDDTYEYATLDELQLFTDAIQRWDVGALEELPPFMKLGYKALLDTYDGIEEEMKNAGVSYRVPYAKEDMKKLARAYFGEAKWLFNKCMPTMEEYMKVSTPSSGYMMLSTNSLLGMGENIVTKEDFDWISSEPLVVRASAAISRYMNDLVGDGYEEKPSSVYSCMNQYGVSKMEAFAQLRILVKNGWKDINQECLAPGAVSKMPILKRVDNLARVAMIIYAEDDGYTNPIMAKYMVKALLVEPLTI